MAGISSKAVLKTLSAYKYNAGSELEDEGELNYNNTFYRKYDAQIGRFTGIDMLAESYAGLTPFQFGNNNPVFYNDPTEAALNYVDPDQEKWVHQSGNVFWGASHQSDIRDGIGMDGEYSAGSFDNGFSGGGGFGFGNAIDYSKVWNTIWKMFSDDMNGQIDNFTSQSGVSSHGEEGTWFNFSFYLNNGIHGGFGDMTTFGTEGLGACFLKGQPNSVAIIGIHSNYISNDESWDYVHSWV